MVKPKRDNKSIMQILRDQAEEMERISPILKTRWYVVEISPARRFHDGYDYTWSRESRRVVSTYFETKEEAVAWMDRHDPDDGNTLKVEHQNLREFKYKKWGV